MLVLCVCVYVGVCVRLCVCVVHTLCTDFQKHSYIQFIVHKPLN